MGRSAILSNGRLAVGLNEKGFVHDFYYPYVGMHNMTSARSIHHKIGLWVDGTFSWLDDEQVWESETVLDENSMMARTLFVSTKLGISLSFRDFVDSGIDFFGRVAILENRIDQTRNCRLFFGQVFQLSKNGRGDTALYAPGKHPYILTYCDDIYFVSSLRDHDGAAFDQFAVGNYGIEGKEGAYVDAEDGELSGNLVEHGGVDSIIGINLTLKPKQSHHIDYWITASCSGYNNASNIHRNLAKNGLYHYLNSTHNYWKDWLSRSSEFINSLDVKYQSIAKRSLLTIRSHIDARGGVVASLDSSIYNYGRDYYSYVWPRDSYYSLMPLLRLGYFEEVRNYLHFVTGLFHRRGYVHHKYLPDGNLGSSWHPLMQDGKNELNIQEDETASTVMLAIEYLRSASDLSQHEINSLIEKIIIPSANFMSEYFDNETGLPHASYDLWEQLFLTSTYTTSTVYSAIKQSIDLVNEYGVKADTSNWVSSIQKIEQNYSKLVDEKNQYFLRGLSNQSNNYSQNITLDISSLFGIAMYGPADKNSTAIFATKEAVDKFLQNPGITKGVVRYPNDTYMMTEDKTNPWYVCTMWLGRVNALLGDIDKAHEALDWAVDKLDKSQMMSEQLDPSTGENRGVTPLVWSHAEYLSLLLDLYL